MLYGGGPGFLAGAISRHDFDLIDIRVDHSRCCGRGFRRPQRGCTSRLRFRRQGWSSRSRFRCRGWRSLSRFTVRTDHARTGAPQGELRGRQERARETVTRVVVWVQIRSMQRGTTAFAQHHNPLPQDETPAVVSADHLLDPAFDLFGGERSGQYRLRMPRATVARIALHSRVSAKGRSVRQASHCRGEKRTTTVVVS